MCEPMHSIVQFPTEPPEPPSRGGMATDVNLTVQQQPVKARPWNWPSGPQLCQKIEEALKWGEGKIGDMLKKIGDFFHLSKLGTGHSGSIHYIHKETMWLPDDTRYEAAWWNRTVKLDGEFHGKEEKRGLALASASEYAKLSSIGSLSTLRKFLEMSMKKTEYIGMYIMKFIDGLIVGRHRNEVVNKVKMICDFRSWCRINVPAEKLDSLIRALLGFTRKRNYLAPEWADDSVLWT